MEREVIIAMTTNYSDVLREIHAVSAELHEHLGGYGEQVHPTTANGSPGFESVEHARVTQSLSDNREILNTTNAVDIFTLSNGYYRCDDSSKLLNAPEDSQKSGISLIDVTSYGGGTPPRKSIILSYSVSSATYIYHFKGINGDSSSNLGWVRVNEEYPLFRAPSSSLGVISPNNPITLTPNNSGFISSGSDYLDSITISYKISNNFYTTDIPYSQISNFTLSNAIQRGDGVVNFVAYSISIQQNTMSVKSIVCTELSSNSGAAAFTRVTTAPVLTVYKVSGNLK